MLAGMAAAARVMAQAPKCSRVGAMCVAGMQQLLEGLGSICHGWRVDRVV
jgi:hypothetical protein